MIKQFLKEKREFFPGFVVGIISFVVYMRTMAPTVGFIDSGELATVVCTLGIAHPTGYPLFTLVGKIFSMLPIASEEIMRLNMMSAFFVSCGLVVFYFFLCELLRSYTQEVKIIASFFATCSLAFSQTLWSQATGIEVYSLHFFLIVTILYFLLKAYHTNEFRWWLIFSFLWGLAFTNHLTSILLAPAVLYFYIKTHGVTKHSFRKLGMLSLPFIASLSLYIYLPIRSAQNPILDWGNPETLEKLLWHISGKQFRVWMFSSTEVASRQLTYYFNELPKEFYYLPLVVSLFGIVYLLLHNRTMFIWIFLLLISCVLYSINYDIHDIDSYFLLSYIAWMMFAAFGVVSFIEKTKNLFRTLVAAFSIVTIGLIVVQHWNDMDRSKEYLVEDYTKNILNDLPQNSILISFQWDYLVSASYYFQYVKKIRPDIVIIDKELLRRSWYFEQLKRNHPQIFNNSKEKILLFLQELYKFEHNLPYEPSSIEGAYSALIQSFVDYNILSAHCFVTSEIEQNYLQGYYRIPYGLVYELKKENTTYVQRQSPHFSFHKPVGNDSYTKNLIRIISTSLYLRSTYEEQFVKQKNADYFRQKAIEIQQ